MWQAISLRGAASSLAFLNELWWAESAAVREQRKLRLLAAVYRTRADRSASAAAASANVLTALNAAQVPLCGLQLAGIQAPGVDLSGGLLDCTDLARANLTGASITRAHLRNVSFEDADLSGALVGERPHVQTDTVTGVNTMDISPDGHLVVTGDYSCSIDLWDAHTGHHVHNLFTTSGSAASVEFDRRGERVLAASDDGTVMVWNVLTRTVALSTNVKHIRNATWAPDGATIAFGCVDGKTLLYDLASKSVQHTLDGHLGVVVTVGFSADGRYMATGSEDRRVRVWELPSARLAVQTDLLRGGVVAVAFDPRGGAFAAGRLSSRRSGPGTAGSDRPRCAQRTKTRGSLFTTCSRRKS